MELDIQSRKNSSRAEGSNDSGSGSSSEDESGVPAQVAIEPKGAGANIQKVEESKEQGDSEQANFDTKLLKINFEMV